MKYDERNAEVAEVTAIANLNMHRTNDQIVLTAARVAD